MINEELSIRNYTKDDENFILNSWTESHFSSSDSNKYIPRKIYLDNHLNIIKKILNHHNTAILIACAKDQPDLIYGYMCITVPHTMNYIYVKRPFNDFGIAKKLIEQAPMPFKYCTHMTHKGSKLLKELNLIYNPYLLGEFK